MDETKRTRENLSTRLGRDHAQRSEELAEAARQHRADFRAAHPFLTRLQDHLKAGGTIFGLRDEIDPRNTRDDG